MGGRRSRGDGPASAAGAVLAAAIAGIGLVRGPRPIHTTGVVLTGPMRWRPPGSTRSGIAWIDDRTEGGTTVTARLSRGAALPAALPDVIGLAIRSAADGRDVDLLLSSTGIGVPGRFVLQPHWSPSRVVLSTLMPYRGASGPVLVAARPVSPQRLPRQLEDVRTALERRPWTLDLLFASATGRWHRFAQVELGPLAGRIDSGTPRFDPVLNPPPGAGTYRWTRALREPSYAVARRGSGSRRA